MGMRNREGKEYAVPRDILTAAANALQQQYEKNVDNFDSYQEERLKELCGPEYAHVPSCDIRIQAANIRKGGGLSKVKGHAPGKNAKDKIEKQANPEYDEYLNSRQWKSLADKAKERDGYSCRVCDNDNRLEVHHRRYPPGDIYYTDNLDNLTTLCQWCHREYHRYAKKRDIDLFPDLLF